MNLGRRLGFDILAEKYAYGRRSPVRLHFRPKDSGQVGGHHLRLLFGRVRHVRRRQGWPGCRRAWKPRASGQSGTLCPKGLAEHYTLEAPNRAKYPLLRQNGKLARASAGTRRWTRWSRSFAPRRSDWPRSARCDQHWRVVTDSSTRWGSWCNWDSAPGITTATRRCACPPRFLATNDRLAATDRRAAYEDLQKADVIFLIGANIAENHPILCQHLEANPRKTLIVADPRVTKTAMMADVFLPLKPRSDVALMNG